MTNMTARKAEFGEIIDLLQRQHARKDDFVAPASDLHLASGHLVVPAHERTLLLPEGVTSMASQYRMSGNAVADLGTRLDVPPGWFRRLHAERPDLWDGLGNGLLHGSAPIGRHADVGSTVYPPHQGSFMVRAFTAEDDDPDALGYVRAMLSNSYEIIDHLDVLLAAKEGIENAGVAGGFRFVGGDLTDRNLYLRIEVPQVRAYAPNFLKGYRNPRTGQTDPEGVIYAGLVISNSETGKGAAQITPRITYLVCTNGQTFTKDAVRAVHLGQKLPDGPVTWSEETRTANLKLVQSMAKDAVETFLNVEYMRKVAEQLEAMAGVQVKDANATLTTVGKAMAWSKELTANVLNFFIQGGQTTAGAVGQAMTAYAQEDEVPPEVQWDLEANAGQAMALAARVQR